MVTLTLLAAAMSINPVSADIEDCTEILAGELGDTPDTWINQEALAGCTQDSVSVVCTLDEIPVWCVFDWCDGLPDPGESVTECTATIFVDRCDDGTVVAQVNGMGNCMIDELEPCSQALMAGSPDDFTGNCVSAARDRAKSCTSGTLAGALGIGEAYLPSEGDDVQKKVTLCATAHGSLEEIDDSVCEESAPKPDTDYVCGYNENGGGGYSTGYDGRAVVAETLAEARVHHNPHCTWQYQANPPPPPAAGNSCNIPFEGHDHWHSPQAMQDPHTIASFATDYPLGPEAAEYAQRSAGVELSYNEDGTIAVVGA